MLDMTGEITTTRMFSVGLPQEHGCHLGIQLFDEYVGLAAEAHSKTIGWVNGERTLVIASVDWTVGSDPISLPLRRDKVRLREKDNPLAMTGDNLIWEGW
jgi:hypothetical protein